MELLCCDTHSLTGRNIFKILENIPNLETKERKDIYSIKKEKKESVFFVPTEKDTLFWCWVLFSSGYKTYEVERHHPFKYEQKSKINLVHTIRENKSKLKEYKLKVKQIETYLMDKIINIETMMAISIIHNYNFLYIGERVYYENIIDEDNKTIVVKEIVKNKQYAILMDTSINTNSFKKTRLSIDRINKPLKAISGYKLKELQDICKTLNIPYLTEKEKNIKKKEMYKKIQEIIY